MTKALNAEPHRATPDDTWTLEKLKEYAQDAQVS